MAADYNKTSTIPDGAANILLRQLKNMMQRTHIWPVATHGSLSY